MANITLRVNGQSRTVDVDPATPLLYVLRNDLDLHGPRFGCGLGQCGACTVLVKGAAMRSCILPVSTVQGAEVTTLEGLSVDGQLHPLQQAWIDEQVPACGNCARRGRSQSRCRSRIARGRTRTSALSTRDRR